MRSAKGLLFLLLLLVLPALLAAGRTVNPPAPVAVADAVSGAAWSGLTAPALLPVAVADAVAAVAVRSPDASNGMIKNDCFPIS